MGYGGFAPPSDYSADTNHQGAPPGIENPVEFPVGPPTIDDGDLVTDTKEA